MSKTFRLSAIAGPSFSLPLSFSILFLFYCVRKLTLDLLPKCLAKTSWIVTHTHQVKGAVRTFSWCKRLPNGTAGQKLLEPLQAAQSSAPESWVPSGSGRLSLCHDWLLSAQVLQFHPYCPIGQRLCASAWIMGCRKFLPHLFVQRMDAIFIRIQCTIPSLPWLVVSVAVLQWWTWGTEITRVDYWPVVNSQSLLTVPDF